ncbi:MAG: glycosyltransferase family 4 protein [Gammaproteobacteria bacterium]|nr:glycosyltransferase family 4 protein [Pseudomonadales bacterium]MCP5347585.1 glycosyltransferase family 4 protein [Pseudomonadales bacterium]
MKVGFLIYSYFPYGGQQRDFYRIVRECVARGHQVVVYTLKWQGEPPADIEVRFVPVTSWWRLRLYRRFTRWVLDALHREPCDLVIGFNKMPGLDVYFAADPCFADKAEHQRGAYYRYTPRYRHFMAYEEAVFGPHSRTRVLLLSRLQQQSYEHYYPDSGPRLHLVPPGIDPNRKPTDAAPVIRRQFRHEFDLESDHLLVLQVGSGFKVKGVDRALRAIASLPERLRQRVTYLLVGQDRPDRYLSLAKKLGIADRFRVLPGRDDIPRFLLGADLLLHPAYSESAGYVLLEATIVGLPVLTTETCGYASHIRAAGSGLVCSEPFQQAELNRNLEHMLTAPERSVWQQQGIDYGRRENLYAMPGAATDYLEQFARAAVG